MTDVRDQHFPGYDAWRTAGPPDPPDTEPFRFYCGAYFGPPLPPEGEPAECGWEGTLDCDPECLIGICPKCGTELGSYDVVEAAR